MKLELLFVCDSLDKLRKLNSCKIPPILWFVDSNEYKNHFKNSQQVHTHFKRLVYVCTYLKRKYFANYR